MEIVLCSDCFQDPGLRIDAQGFGADTDGTCPVCRSDTGKKLGLLPAFFDARIPPRSW